MTSSRELVIDAAQEMLDAFLTTLALCHTVRIDKKDDARPRRGFSFLRNITPSRRWMRKFLTNSARGIVDDTGLGLEPNTPAPADGAQTSGDPSGSAKRRTLQRRPSLGEAEEAVAGEPVGASAETPELVRRGSGRASRRSRAGSRLEGLEPSELITNMAEMSAYEYKASSPDEKAFVDSCRSYGYVFCGVDDEDNAVLRVFERPPDARVQPQSVVGMLPHRRAPQSAVSSSRPSSAGRSSHIARYITRKYRLIHILPFDSDRKCMSVILQAEDGTRRHSYSTRTRSQLIVFNASAISVVVVVVILILIVKFGGLLLRRPILAALEGCGELDVRSFRTTSADEQHRRCVRQVRVRLASSPSAAFRVGRAGDAARGRLCARGSAHAGDRSAATQRQRVPPDGHGP